MLKSKAFFLMILIACATCIMDSPAVGQGSADEVDKAFTRAMELHQSGDIQGAIRGYETILAKHPNRVDVRSNLGAAYSRLGRYEEAINQYKQALKLDAGNQTVRFNLALAYYKGALLMEAANELAAMLATTPPEWPQRSTATIILAECYVRTGSYKKAIELLGPIAQADPSNRTVAFLLGSALLSNGQLEQGQVLIDKVFHDEDSAEAHLLLGSTLLLSDNGLGALKEFERAIQIDANLPTLQAWYGRALMRMGDSTKAKTAFRAELEKNQNDFDANLFMGVLLRQDKDYDEALQYLSRAVILRPRDQYARYHEAAVYAALGKPVEALPLLEGVAKEYPEFSEARVLLASVYYRLNRKQDGDREKAAVQKLTAEKQAQQPGAQSDNSSPAAKPTPEFEE